MEREIAPQLHGAERDKGDVQRQMINNKLKEIAERDGGTVQSSSYQPAEEGGRNPEQTLLALLDDFVSDQRWKIYQNAAADEWTNFFSSLQAAVRTVCEVIEEQDDRLGQ